MTAGTATRTESAVSETDHAFGHTYSQLHTYLINQASGSVSIGSIFQVADGLGVIDRDVQVIQPALSPHQYGPAVEICGLRG